MPIELQMSMDLMTSKEVEFAEMLLGLYGHPEQHDESLTQLKGSQDSKR